MAKIIFFYTTYILCFLGFCFLILSNLYYIILEKQRFREVNCSECNGTGIKPAWTCPICQGTGKRPNNEPCGLCDGTGILPEGTCPICGGCGKMWEEIR